MSEEDRNDPVAEMLLSEFLEEAFHNNDSVVVEQFSAPEVIEKLLGFVFTVRHVEEERAPGTSGPSCTCHRLACNAGMILSSPYHHPLYALGSSPVLLEKLFSFFDTPEPILNRATSYYGAILTNLFKHPENVPEVFRYLESDVEVAKNLLDNLDSSSILDAVFALFERCQVNRKFLLHVTSNKLLHVVAALTHPAPPGQTAEQAQRSEHRQGNAAAIILWILNPTATIIQEEHESREGVGMFMPSSASLDVVPRHLLIRHLMTTSVLDAIIDPLCTASIPFSRRHQYPIKIITATVVQLVVFLRSYVDSSLPENTPLFNALQTSLDHVLNATPWAQLFDHLRRPRALISTTSHEGRVPALGVIGLSIVELIVALGPACLHHGDTAERAADILFGLDGLGTAVDMFFEHPWHASLHDSVTVLLETILSPSADERTRARASAYVCHIGLPFRLLSAPRALPSDPDVRLGYCGYITKLSVLLRDTSAMELLLHSDKDWQRFVGASGALNDVLATEAVALCDDSLDRSHRNKREAKEMKEVRKAIAASMAADDEAGPSSPSQPHKGVETLAELTRQKQSVTEYRQRLKDVVKENESYMVRMVSLTEAKEVLQDQLEEARKNGETAEADADALRNSLAARDAEMIAQQEQLAALQRKYDELLMKMQDVPKPAMDVAGTRNRLAWTMPAVVVALAVGGLIWFRKSRE